MSASKAGMSKKRATRGYTGTQKDDYTGTPGKRSAKVKPKPRDPVKARAAGSKLRKQAARK